LFVSIFTPSVLLYASADISDKVNFKSELEAEAIAEKSAKHPKTKPFATNIKDNS
jgi:hypothetical protein